MKPVRFRYEAPHTVEEAVDHLSAAGIGGKALAGGQSLVPMMNFRLARPSVLVDLNGIAALRGITVAENHVELGALVRHQAVADSERLRHALPVLARTASLIGHWGIRTRGTVGGSVVHADPSAEWPAVLAALGAELELVGPSGTRRVPAGEFILGPLTTAIETDEILSRIYIPRAPAPLRCTIEEMARRPGDFALAGSVAVHAGQEIRWTFFGLGGPPETVAVAQADRQDEAALRQQLAERVAELEVTGDMHGGAEWRRRVAVAVALRAWRQIA